MHVNEQGIQYIWVKRPTPLHFSFIFVFIYKRSGDSSFWKPTDDKLSE